MKNSRMYADTKTWNVASGCGFGCTYCVPSFQAQLKRWAKKNCPQCYRYEFHLHPERLKQISASPIVFIGGNSDIHFWPTEFLLQVIDRIEVYNEHYRSHKWMNYQWTQKTFYLQSKHPETFNRILKNFPENVILLTTLETNRTIGYHHISKAPDPYMRWSDFKNLDYPRKGLTIEPVMDFDHDRFLQMILEIKPKPEFAYLGYNSRPKQVQLPDPPEKKVKELKKSLENNGIEVRPKDLRGIKI